jgi:aspartate-semialdehyde dehydrogenase
MKVAVLGATGAVGREMLRTLEERRFPLDELVPLASSRSAGVRLPFADEVVEVGAVERDAFEEVGIALFSAGADASKEWAPVAVAAGATVVDNSSAFRMEPDVPLVVPEINREALDGHRGIVANPNCTAITAVMAVAPLHMAAGLSRLVASSYQSVSGAGHRGVAELLEQVEKLRDAEEDLARPDPDALPAGDVFGRTIAYNVLPRGGSFDPDGATTEETKFVNETRKILGLPKLEVAVTVVRVPVIVGHSVSIYAELEEDLPPEAARLALARFPGVEVVDDPLADRFPTPLDAAGRDEVLVGRIRPGPRRRSRTLLASGGHRPTGAAPHPEQSAEALTG